MSEGVLLDTCAVIWMVGAAPFSDSARKAVQEASLVGRVMVSPASAWEVGLAARKQQGAFLPDAKSWFSHLMSLPGIGLAALTPEIAIDSSHLPGPLHNDPADRLLIATARALGVPIVTRDAKILVYGRAGHVKTIAC
jgi:PIN domain nuclease of toxin-antitoxin system